MSSYLIVPIKLDALALTEPKTVKGARADFSNLPWSDGQKDYHADVPFLGQAVTSKPFQGPNYTLNKGVHLHWTLPRALRTSSGDTLGFKAAPNRWLVTRSVGGDATSAARWIVESDFLATEQSAEQFNQGAVTIPFFSSLGSQSPRQPYRFLGRQMPASQWQETNNKDWQQAFGNFTALGYGEFSFSTFYPNCRSVFGSYDSDITILEANSKITYEVLGWYSNPDDDILTDAVAEIDSTVNQPGQHLVFIDKLFDNNGHCPPWYTTLVNDTAGSANWPAGAPISADDYKQVRDRVKSTNPDWLSELLNLSADAKNQFYLFGIEKILAQKCTTNTDSSTPDYPTLSLYYGTIEVTKNPNSSIPTFQKVAIGYTGAEALSAYLAETISQESKGFSKGKIEDQLEGILLGSKIKAAKIDLGPDFEEARHKKGFIGQDGGVLWTVRKIKQTGAQANNDLVDGAATLPDNLALTLNNLNVAQKAYEKATEELETQYFHIYSSWCKYMQSCYPPLGDHENFPDVDEIRALIEEQLGQLQGQLDSTGLLHLSMTQGKVDISTQSTGTLANNVLSAYASLTSELKNCEIDGYSWQVSYTPGPRYYAPRDPVVLLVSEVAAAKTQAISEADSVAICTNNVTIGSNEIPDISGVEGLSVAVSFQSTQGSWNSQILDWLVEFFPVKPKSNLDSPSGQYDPTFITSNFQLNEDQFDLTQQDLLMQNSVEYSGSTHTSSQVGERVKDALRSFIKSEFPDAFSSGNFETDFSKLYQSENKPDETNAGFTALKAYNSLKGVSFVSQSLGGFHNALLQQSSNLSMPIADPLGFSDYQVFTSKVATALKGVFPPAPRPQDLFIPLGAGGLRLMELEVTDHFGRSVNANIENVLTTEQLVIPDHPGWSWLAPRFSQAVRLNFRWLSSDGSSEMEMNSHPASSPICGWILPNYLDQSLVVYTSDGDGLGSFLSGGSWEPFPGSSNPISDQEFTTANPKELNGHLLNVLTFFKNKVSTNQSFISHFITALQGAQENIYPESYAGHDALSILIGKPIAIVRASVSLEAKGGARPDQGWNPLRLELQSGKLSTDNYENISIPVRLGEYRQLNDGLIGYWKESNGGLEDAAFYINDSIAASCPNESAAFPGTIDSTQAANIQALLKQNSDYVKRQDFASAMPDGGKAFDNLVAADYLKRVTPVDDSIDYYADVGLIEQSLSADPTKVTMLMDPHGIVHATTGLLPVKTIQIPADQYSAALRKIAVTFLTSPIITPKNVVKLSLPSEAGHAWSWLEKDKENGKTAWKELPDFQTISNSAFVAGWKAFVAKLDTTNGLPAALKNQNPWDELLSKNWVEVIPGTTTLFQVTKDGSAQRVPLEQWKNYTEEIQRVIQQNSSGLEPFDLDARFYPRQEIREGWLKLIQTDRTTSQKNETR